tara:strand:+ start:1566 stop:1742 length:177 start_codon:yes stop_codon:yes gene_type:complete
MSIKKRYIVELTEAQIRFIKYIIYYAESEIETRNEVYNACEKALENGLKTLKLQDYDK